MLSLSKLSGDLLNLLQLALWYGKRDKQPTIFIIFITCCSVLIVLTSSTLYLLKMPKKTKKGGKKKSTVVKPEINIVDEGQSSFDLTEVERAKKKAAEQALAAPPPAPVVPQPVIDIAEEAEEVIKHDIDDEGVHTETNNFSISEVTKMRKMDSLAVIGKQSSINSNFSFFSDNNLTERDDLEDIEQHHLTQRNTVYSSYMSEQSVTTVSCTFNTSVSRDTLDSLEHTEEPGVVIEELEDDNHEQQTARRVQFNSTNNLENKIQWSTTDSERFTDQYEEPDGFLDNLKDEIKLVESNVEITEVKKTEEKNDDITTEMSNALKDKIEITSPTTNSKSSIGWGNITFKREIKLGIKKETSSETSETVTWEEKFRNQTLDLFDEAQLNHSFSVAAFKVSNRDLGFGLVSTNSEVDSVNIVFLEDVPDFLQVQLVT